MIYDWYKIANLDEFVATGLYSQELTLDLEGLGQKELLLTNGNAISILYEGVYLSVNFNENNPFEFEDHAVYLDAENNIYLGIGVNES
jgi:hypothetical protein